MQPFYLLRNCKRRRVLPLAGLVLLGSTASAQTVKGLIVDANGALPGATIRVSGNPAATNTDLDGSFSLNADSIGKVRIEISYVGHQTRNLDLNVGRGLNDAGTIELHMDQSRLGEVLVKGTMAPSQAKAQSIKRNAVAIMEVISADAIGKLPDRNAAEAVQRVQGVAVARYHGEADQATVRGTPFSWTSTLFNGSRLPSANVLGNRATVLDVIPSEIIQYVQVAKAITPDMEGDAIGGAINFITRTAPEKRSLGLSAAGGYNTFSQNGTYNGSLVYGDRFFRNKLGVIVAGAIWDRQWGTDSYELSYNTGLADAQQQKSINTAMLKRYMGKRQTYGLNAGLEYVFNSANKIYFRGLMDRFNDIRPVYESYVDFTNSRYQYNYRYSHYQTVLNGGELGGEHQLGAKLRMDWSYSNYSTRYYLETPPTNPNKGLPIATFRQRITGGFANTSADGKMYWNFDSPDGKGITEGRFDPVLNNPAEVMDPAKLTLQQLVIAQLNTKEADQVGQLNFRFEPNARLHLKAGLKFRHKYREGLYGSSFVYIPGAALGVQGAPALQSLASLETTSFPKGSGFFHEMPGNYGQYVMNPLTRDQLFDLLDPATLQTNGYRDLTPATNATNIYSGTEDVMAAYVMAEYDVTTKLKLVGGVRNEYTMMQLNGSRAVTEGSPATTRILPSTVESNYNALLPMLHAKFALNDRANLRAAYTKTFMRPNFVDLSPGEAIDNTKNPIAITKGNPALKPTFSNNYDLMGEYYFKGLGLISGGFFYKDISDVVFSNRSFYNEGGNNYMLTQARNFDRAKLYGLEAGINKRFTFLPGFWSGFGAEFNYTFIQSETKLDRLVLNADKSYTTVTDKLRLPNQSRDLFNAILFYERSGVMVRVAGNYRGASVETVNQQLGPDFYIWTDRNFTIDASATVNVTKNIRAFVELNNLSDEPLKTYMGDRRRITMNEWYGRRGQAGIRWDIIK